MVNFENTEIKKQAGNFWVKRNNLLGDLDTPVKFYGGINGPNRLPWDPDCM